MSLYPQSQPQYGGSSNAWNTQQTTQFPSYKRVNDSNIVSPWKGKQQIFGSYPEHYFEEPTYKNASFDPATFPSQFRDNNKQFAVSAQQKKIWESALLPNSNSNQQELKQTYAKYYSKQNQSESNPNPEYENENENPLPFTGKYSSLEEEYYPNPKSSNLIEFQDEPTQELNDVNQPTKKSKRKSQEEEYASRFIPQRHYHPETRQNNLRFARGNSGEQPYPPQHYIGSRRPSGQIYPSSRVIHGQQNVSQSRPQFGQPNVYQGPRRTVGQSNGYLGQRRPSNSGPFVPRRTSTNTPFPRSW